MAAALPFVALGAQVLGSIYAGKKNAQQLRMQGVVARQQALSDEESQRRENRSYRGYAAAALAENGLSADGSSGAMVDQNASLAELDALNIRYKGVLRGKGFNQAAGDASRAGNMLAGQQLLTGGSDIYTRRQMTGT